MRLLLWSILVFLSLTYKDSIVGHWKNSPEGFLSIEEPAAWTQQATKITKTQLLLCCILFWLPHLPPSLFVPKAVQDVPIRVNPQHHVVCGGVVDEGALGMDEEHIGNPNLLHQTAVKCHTLVVGALEGQTLVLPVVTEVQSHGEVLLEKKRDTSTVWKISSSTCGLKSLQTVYYHWCFGLIIYYLIV